MEASALQQVFGEVVDSKLTYAAPAWRGFTTSVDRQRLDAVLRRAVRSDLWTLSGKPDAHTSVDLCNSADDELFIKIRTSNHILQYMHSCQHNPPHHNITILDSVSYPNAQHIFLTVISRCACFIRTPTRPSYCFYFTTFSLYYVKHIATVFSS